MIEVNDQGFITVRVVRPRVAAHPPGEQPALDQEPEVTEKLLDLYEVNNRVFEIQRVHQGKPSYQFQQGVSKILEEMGFPGLSCYAADRFVAEMNRVMDELSKKNGASPRPGSPSPSASESLAPAPPASTS